MSSGQRSVHTPSVDVCTQMPLLQSLLSLHESPKPSRPGVMSGIGNGVSAMSSSEFPPTPVPRSQLPPPQWLGLSADAQPITNAAATSAAPLTLNFILRRSSVIARSIHLFADFGSTDFRSNYFENAPSLIERGGFTRARRSRSPARIRR